MSQVIPLYKKGNRDCFSNCRPVSMVSVISKVVKTSIKSQILKHLKENNVLYTENLVSFQVYPLQWMLKRWISDILDSLHPFRCTKCGSNHKTNASIGEYIYTSSKCVLYDGDNPINHIGCTVYNNVKCRTFPRP
ncbi:hypothetical protein J6590_067045 [Homalodisca vitripennis]|nr:hypothetical protein J6590_067045 [Homalodisca vitripennis]